jgi:hypothetical protein
LILWIINDIGGKSPMICRILPHVFFLKATWSFKVLYAILKRVTGYGSSLFLKHLRYTALFLLKAEPYFQNLFQNLLLRKDPIIYPVLYPARIGTIPALTGFV